MHAVAFGRARQSERVRRCVRRPGAEQRQHVYGVRVELSERLERCVHNVDHMGTASARRSTCIPGRRVSCCCCCCSCCGAARAFELAPGAGALPVECRDRLPVVQRRDAERVFGGCRNRAQHVQVRTGSMYCTLHCTLQYLYCTLSTIFADAIRTDQ